MKNNLRKRKSILFNRASLLTIIYLGSSIFLNAQTFFPKKNYPTTFQNPVDIPISIVGNFGECRPNHFHSGVDIRTEGKENQIVRSMADGYVSRVKIEAGGFGNAIYITHGAYTTLYAHLNKFYPELESYIRAQQYKNRDWNIDIPFLPHQFPVRKGAFIAWSGNTGSSQGPHLHLEIRDTKTEAPLNGLFFFNWKDGKAPLLKKLAMYDGTKSIYNQSPVVYPIFKNKLSKEIIVIHSDKVFFGIAGDDFMEIATGTLGIFEMNMYVDDKPFFAWQMDNISYDITRYMNAIADYKTKKNNGPWIQLCRRLPNDKLPVYKDFSNTNGVIDLPAGTSKNIRIEVYDTRYNKSSLSFTIKSNKPAAKMVGNNEFIAGSKNSFQNDNMSFVLAPEQLYDNIYFTTSIKPATSEYSHLYQLHTPEVPLHTYFDILFVPKTTIPISLKDKIAVVRYPYGTETTKKGKAATLVNGKVKATIRDFGKYEIVIDQKAPTILSTIKNNTRVGNLKQLNFVVKDETTSVKKVEAFIDGQWLRIVQKGDHFYYEMDDHFPFGTHQLLVTAYDENNNVQKISYTLTR
jgi:hypothetical protein